jgi:hypothetical protein
LRIALQHDADRAPILAPFIGNRYPAARYSGEGIDVHRNQLHETIRIHGP